MTTRREQASMKVRVDKELREQLTAKANELHLSTQHVLEVCVRAFVLGLGGTVERAMTRHDPENAAQVMAEQIRRASKSDDDLDYFEIEQD